MNSESARLVGQHEQRVSMAGGSAWPASQHSQRYRQSSGAEEHTHTRGCAVSYSKLSKRGTRARGVGGKEKVYRACGVRAGVCVCVRACVM